MSNTMLHTDAFQYSVSNTTKEWAKIEMMKIYIHNLKFTVSANIS